ncbi:MAG TPA: tRNA pseudouridine(55) synthase TruB [Vicinamibacterales bacterium]|jgi:tRNA pseudouridine55 synthase
MDGLLVVDKPVGPTSHDVVARVRRILGERRIGHTGTLDPLASGVLPLVIGRATRLARFLSAADKIYEAEVTLGIATDSGDREGHAIAEPYAGALPERGDVEQALQRFRGSFPQRPPALSAKKIGGVRSYRLARRGRLREAAVASADETPALDRSSTAAPQPVTVSVSGLELLSYDAPTLLLRVACSAGFYVRALARDLGEALGTGAHLSALRRTASGRLTLREAVALAAIDDRQAGRQRALEAIIPPSRMLTDLPGASLTPEGLRRAVHGRELDADAFSGPVAAGDGFVRLLDADGNLVGVAERGSSAGVLHPAVVLM